MIDRTALPSAHTEHLREKIHLDSLSARQLEVLDMAAQGLSNGAIATRLHLSVHAVKFHLAAVYEKLGVANRTEAAVVYLRTLAG